MKSTQRRSDKGGEEEVVVTTIRIPLSIMQRVEAAMDAEELQLSKNVWFLTAIKEKLDRSEKKK